ncbi:fungal-specific transcription factor domain-containing protein [Phanerochaete sordida]|uniref:Fungal-specific transcription factor domain-containing protein n=1 Tax=Phanerochaete sordida TaxID=48140 RepID=A0A9P3LDC7_9APHY|nr:fungal-specific transcription factor domain-containing protein [Phanerochaete sordida]
MSSDGGEQTASQSATEKATKKRRVRACDQCRRRKVKCDGAEVAGNRCTNCVAFKYQCTYLAGSDKRFCDVEYVQNLEAELTETRQLVRKLQAEIHSLRNVSSSPPEFAIVASNPSEYTPPPIASGSRQTTPSGPCMIRLTPHAEELLDDDTDEEGLIHGFKSLNVKAEQTHFLGRSSNLMLIRTAMDLKQEYSQTADPTTPSEQHSVLTSRRPQFWDYATTLLQPDPPYTSYPEPLLMFELVEEYFLHLNCNFPLLHRPTFEAGIRAGLHLRDEGFGATVLLVCAIGARFSQNPAVLHPGARNWHWAGWQWFDPVRERRKLVPLTPARLYDLQVAALVAAYVGASAVPHAMYATIGHGLRLAQDLGAHRRTTYPAIPTVESELKKRAFWCLVAMDRGMCSVLGRPCSIQDEDYDLDYPIECDDEYWENEDPTLAFKQPPGRASTVDFFTCILRLGRLHAYALRGIYSLHAAARIRTDPQWAQQVVSELDSGLNKWVDSIPDHLKWDPHQPNLLFVNQSALLYSSYYSLQIAVHRPFIPMPRKPSPLSFPSLAICTNAARSCIHVLDRQYARLGSALFHHWHQLTLFTAAIILLLNIWGSKYTGAAVDTDREMAEVKKALDMLQALEPRWNTAGRFWDILHELATFVDVPGQKKDPLHQKRRRDDDSSAEQQVSPAATGEEQGHRNIAGSKRAEQYQQSALSSSPSAASPFAAGDFDFTLPMHSDELGRLPVGGADFDFSSLPAQDPWQSLGGPSFHASQPFDPAAGAPGMDPTLEAIFSDLLPVSSYEDAFAALTQTAPQYPNPFFSGPVHPEPAPPSQPAFAPAPAGGPADPSLAAPEPPMWTSELGGSSWNLGQYLNPSGGEFPT